MESVLTNSGYGDGYGDGYGYGYGDGSGYGYGYGYGSGYGSGYGYGYGDVIAKIAGHAVLFIRAFHIVVIGCQTWSVAEWQKRWKAIAKSHDIEVTQERVDELLVKIKELGNGST